MLLLRSRLERNRGASGAAQASVDEALAVATTVGDADLVAWMMFERAFLRYWVADIEGAYRLLLEAHEHVKRTRSKRGGVILYWLARCAGYRGDLTEAAAFGEEAIAALPYQSKFFRALTHVTRSHSAFDIADFASALEEARHSNALVRELGLPQWIASTDWEIGAAALALGDAEGARGALVEAVDLFERRKAAGQIPEVRARLARALVMLGDISSARDHAEAARALALPDDLESRYIAAVALAEVCEAEGDVVEADALFREAVTLLERSGFGNVLATAREHYARFLIRRGRGGEARLQLDRVLAFYVDPLAERHRQRVDALLRAAASTA